MGLRSGNQYSLNQLICPFFLLLCFLISRLHTDLGFIFFFFRSRLSSYRSVCHIFTWKMSCSTDLPVLIELHFSFIFGRLCLCLEDQQSQLMKPTFLSMSFMLSVCLYWVFLFSETDDVSSVEEIPQYWAKLTDLQPPTSAFHFHSC